jgi:hypothetical protein
MSRDEQLKLIREIREDRQVSKRAVTKKVAKKQKTEQTVLEKFTNLTPEEQEAIMKLLESKK